MEEVLRSARCVRFDRVLLVLLLLVLAVVAVFPFYWLVVGSVMTPAECSDRSTILRPRRPRTYSRIFKLSTRPVFCHSVIVSGCLPSSRYCGQRGRVLLRAVDLLRPGIIFAL